MSNEQAHGIPICGRYYCSSSDCYEGQLSGMSVSNDFRLSVDLGAIWAPPGFSSRYCARICNDLHDWRHHQVVREQADGGG